MRLAFPSILGITLAIACGTPSEPEPTGEFQVTNLRFFLEQGDSFRFVAAGSGSRDVEWWSSNPAVVTIDKTGLAIARTPGFSNMQASASWGWRLEVVRRIAAIKVTPDSIDIVPGDKVSFEASAVDAHGLPVTEGPQSLSLGAAVWSVADPTIARLDANDPRLVTGVREGRTTVRGDLLSRTGTARLKVRLLEFTELGAGISFNCALATDSLPYCWGDGTQFLAAPGTGWWTPSFVPHRAGTHRAMVSLVTGGQHSCGLTVEGLAYCWGSNEAGALGIGTAEQPIGPVAVSGSLRFVSLSAGTSHTCGISTDGQTFCWGRRQGVALSDAAEICGFSGKLDMRFACNRAPAPLGGGSLEFGSLSAGGTHTCGLDREGRAHCWGSWNSRLEPLPVPIPGSQTFVAISSGHGYSCGLTLTGQAYCWGGNTDGQLGDGSTTSSDSPVAVAGGLAFASLSASHRGSVIPETSGHICGVTLQHAVYCWGENGSGQSADPRGPPQRMPTPLITPLAFHWVRAGGDHTCGLSLERVVYCWGFNSSGQLGAPADHSPSSPPVIVTGQRAGSL